MGSGKEGRSTELLQPAPYSCSFPSIKLCARIPAPAGDPLCYPKACFEGKGQRRGGGGASTISLTHQYLVSPSAGFPRAPGHDEIRNRPAHKPAGEMETDNGHAYLLLYTYEAQCCSFPDSLHDAYKGDSKPLPTFDQQYASLQVITRFGISRTPNHSSCMPHSLNYHQSFTHPSSRRFPSCGDFRRLGHIIGYTSSQSSSHHYRPNARFLSNTNETCP